MLLELTVEKSWSRLSLRTCCCCVPQTSCPCLIEHYHHFCISVYVRILAPDLPFCNDAITHCVMYVTSGVKWLAVIFASWNNCIHHIVWSMYTCTCVLGKLWCCLWVSKILITNPGISLGGRSGIWGTKFYTIVATASDTSPGIHMGLTYQFVLPQSWPSPYMG